MPRVRRGLAVAAVCARAKSMSWVKTWYVRYAKRDELLISDFVGLTLNISVHPPADPPTARGEAVLRRTRARAVRSSAEARRCCGICATSMPCSVPTRTGLVTRCKGRVVTTYESSSAHTRPSMCAVVLYVSGVTVDGIGSNCL